MDSTVNLDQLSASQDEQETRVNELLDAASPATIYGRRASTCTGLVFGYYGGPGPFNATAIANGTVTCGASTTTYVVAARASGAVSSATSTTNWNDSTNYARLYKLVSGGSAITSYEDHRMRAGGALAGGSAAPSSADTVTALSIASGVVDIDCGLGDYFTLTLTANVTSITFSNLPGSGKGASKLVRVTQGAGPYTVAWPASLKWAFAAPGAVSTGNGAVDLLGISTHSNGTAWDAVLSNGMG